MPWDFWLIFVALGVLLPWRGYVKFQRLLAVPAVGRSERIVLYLATILFQWIAVAITAWRAQARGLSLAELGLAGWNSTHLAIAGIVGAALFALLHWWNLRRIGQLGVQRIGRLRAVAERIFPRSRVELLPYLALSLTAGLCEEFLYRGFAMAALFRVGLPGWSVILLSAVLFGLAHLYQGKSGLAGTLLLGVVFGVARILYDSIVPIIFWHAAVDVVAGVAGSRYLVEAGEGQKEAQL
jgi:CAAX protease family protein